MLVGMLGSRLIGAGEELRPRRSIEKFIREGRGKACAVLVEAGDYVRHHCYALLCGVAL